MQFEKIPLPGETERAQLYKTRLNSETRRRLKSRLEREVHPHLDENPILKFGGRVCRAHRHFAFFSRESKGYHFSGNTAHAKDVMPEVIDQLMSDMNQLTEQEGVGFNGALVNYYPDGSSKISKHSDQISDLYVSAGVLSISIGATRTFNIYSKNPVRRVKSIHLRDGDVIWMAGSDFQKLFKHEIPCEKCCEGGRWSLTFRSYRR